MLLQTFCHIQGIGLATERKLWEAGILSWEHWQTSSTVPLIHASSHTVTNTLLQSRACLSDQPSFFLDRLPSSQHWRIFPHFRSKTAYIDIETTGLGYDAEITTIALYDGDNVYYFINGINFEDFVDTIDKYQVLVSYNGKSFDIPIIERFFRIKLNHAHVDLRYIMAQLGFTGGLKGCEKQLGIHRGALAGIDGYFAVLLWQQYQQYGDEKALETLLAYNIEDTVNLERLLVEAYNRNLAATPFIDNLCLDFPQPPVIPFQPNLDCVERLKTVHYGFG